MALISEDHYVVPSKGILTWINSRISVVIFIFTAIICGVLAYSFDLFDTILMPAYLLLVPIIPAIVLENYWVRTLRSEQNTNTEHFFKVVVANRGSFIITGYLLSFFLALVSYIPLAVFRSQSISGDNQFIRIPFEDIFSAKNTMQIIIPSVFFALLVTASFFRVRAEDYNSGRRYHFISNPAQVMLLISYTMIGIFTTPTFLWIGNLMVLEKNQQSRITIESITDYAFSYMLLFFMAFYISLVIFVQHIPKLIDHSKYRLPSRRSLIQITLSLAILSSASALIIRYRANMINNYVLWNLSSFDRLLIGAILIVYTFMTLNLHAAGKVCENCNLLMIADKCPSCNERSNFTLPIQLSRKKLILHPRCPYCGEKWVSLDNQCTTDGCKFKVQLNCEYCGSPVNPLWKQCSICKRERKSMVEKALETPGSEGYARSVAYFRVLLAFILPAVVFQVSNIIQILMSSINRSGEMKLTVYDLGIIYYSFIQISVFLIISLFLIGFLLYHSNEQKRALTLVASRIAIAPFSMLIMAILINFSSRSWELVGFEVRYRRFVDFLLLILSLIFLYLLVRASYKLLLSFRPVIPFNPNLAMDRRSID